MFRRLTGVVLILLLTFPLSGLLRGQGSPVPEMIAASGGRFDAALELISQQATFVGTRLLAASAGASLTELARYFHVDVAEPDPVVHLLVQVQNGDIAELESAGFPVLSRLGDVVATSTPLSQLNRLRALMGVVKAEAARVLRPEIDTSMAVTRANLVRTHLGSGVFSGQTGANTLVAIMDSGIDIFHQDFRKPNGNTRIKAIWDVVDQSFRTSGGLIGSAPPLTTAGGQPIGTAYTEAQINAALVGSGFVNARSLEGHGNHVAGIAAGNGRATGGGQVAGQFIGMAPEADLIVVQVFDDAGITGVTFDDRVLAGLNFIDQKATALGRPVAVNMSFGTQVGAHDGTSLLERAIDTFSGPGKRGRVVVKSAGNDGTQDLHAGGQFGPPGSLNNTIVVQVTKSGLDRVMLDFWFSGSDTFNVTIDGGGFGPSVLTGLVQTDPANGDKELLFDTGRNGTFTIFIQGISVTSGRFDAWIPSRNARFDTFSERLRRLTLPGTARNIITVVSFNTKNSWVDSNGIARSSPFIEIGNLSTFSSDGPTRDGRVKPELAAPGQRIASALAGNFSPCSANNTSIFSCQDVLPDTVHVLSQGTSFAAPHATGLAALVLSKNPDLDAFQVRNLMIQNVLRDAFTGSGAEFSAPQELLPDVRWGYGKLDAKAVLDATPNPIPVQFLAFIDSPSPDASVASGFPVVGWALASNGISAIDILIDGRVATAATLGTSRPDVCAIFPTFGPDCPGVGFRAQLLGLDFGTHLLALRITDRLGNRNETAVAPRTIRVEPFPIRALIDSPAAGSTVSPNFEMFGWAISDAGIRMVEILVDGIFVKNALLRQTRPDVCAAFPGGDPACPQVGYRALLDGLTTGPHQLTARVTDNNGAVRPVIAGIQVAPPRIGAVIDAPASGAMLGSSLAVTGWATSPFGISSIEMQVDGALLGLASLNIPRPDVCAAFPGADPACPNVGFTGNLSDIALGAHTLTLVIRDSRGEIAMRQVNFTVVTRAFIDTPAAGAVLSNPFEVVGWAISASGVTNVSVLLDGAVVATGSRDRSRPDVCAVFPGSDPGCPNVGFSAVLSTFPGLHRLEIHITNGAGQSVVLPLPPIGISIAALLPSLAPRPWLFQAGIGTRFPVSSRDIPGRTPQLFLAPVYRSHNAMSLKDPPYAWSRRKPVIPLSPSYFV